ncbi:MAG: hypothetical protein A3B74_03635 [Candidatus Kerfeldbacteria bacterium RIFCSPHIGHO2_02_FULL_42_14]|uniref:Uncharacterized protein n=1 Tax=Candidatus Kerfeldbacteria bacterium RIFCSPHIGHO2_02_FULL_42_14 TaxID=1798540 RepID=A0A1G2AR24_9BACT|nr:MAG: hypothetical protein A3B74_03635 [Candidatus Kerfeldbacteria bacterium RIFCSPHIGHO2_02_FULL_42_14]OGY80609.1 MAG: hypothetical protein A3E60_04130 [Candidatus Kerfeldbacteria bacterium RIFCSPHIGHO2_12_FULL_42_13]OGY82533.1 MAG: hypothetical protein A3I91_03795 [Candidatus Kerfeldbacteria bacterium RIFCSPLOWO2_02_FULL_42_19]OGY87544.1 MAG: hypothetical protein A3G01_00800 [Candidatus Kerfeldbacteria bacterium RIFCSPLOWO2_12_FULL_43_9]
MEKKTYRLLKKATGKLFKPSSYKNVLAQTSPKQRESSYEKEARDIRPVMHPKVRLETDYDRTNSNVSKNRTHYLPSS